MTHFCSASGVGLHVRMERNLADMIPVHGQERRQLFTSEGRLKLNYRDLDCMQCCSKRV